MRNSAVALSAGPTARLSVDFAPTGAAGDDMALELSFTVKTDATLNFRCRLFSEALCKGKLGGL